LCEGSKPQLSAKTIDRDWPHQVALLADQVIGESHRTTHEFCHELSLCPRGHTVRRDNTTYSVFCFADPSHADEFRGRFGGSALIPTIAVAAANCSSGTSASRTQAHTLRSSNGASRLHPHHTNPVLLSGHLAPFVGCMAASADALLFFVPVAGDARTSRSQADAGATHTGTAN
jgi:hypothetical protein